MSLPSKQSRTFVQNYQQELLYSYWQNDPFSAFYNMDGLKDVFLTCDVDWAPDYALEYVLKLVESYGLKLTIFTTHESELLKNQPDFVEIALHPDYTRQNGTLFEDALKKLKAAYPQALGSRSHRNFFGQNIADLNYRYGLEYDASLFLWNQPFCQGSQDHLGMSRFSYFWEDGIHLDMGLPLSWKPICLNTPGLKIINIHPMLIYLNSKTDNHRRSVTSKYRDLTQAPQREVDPFRNKSTGIKDLWESLLSKISKEGIRTHTLSQLHSSIKNSKNKPVSLNQPCGTTSS